MDILKVQVIGTDKEQYFYLDDPEQRIAYNELVENEGIDNLIISEVDDMKRIQFLCIYQNYTTYGEPGLIYRCIIWARDVIDAAKAAAKLFELEDKDAWREIEVDELAEISTDKVEYPDISLN